MFDRVYKSLKGREHPIRKGFYLTDRRPYLYVSKEGEAYNDKTKKLLQAYYTAQGYIYFYVTDPVERIPAHNLVAETFLEKPDTELTLVVNHIDGNKHNPSLSNLEWSTYTHNLLHAYREELRGGAISVYVKDLVTGEIKQYYSQGEACRAIGVNNATMTTYLQRGATTPLRRRYDVRREGEDWKGFTYDPLVKAVGAPLDLVARNKTTGIATIFRGVLRASERTGVDKGTILRRLRRKAEGKPVKPKAGPSQDWEFFLLEEFQSMLTGKEEVVGIKKATTKKRGGRKAPPIKVTNLKTKEVKIYDSLRSFAASVGVNMEKIRKSIWRKVPWRIYFIEYL